MKVDYRFLKKLAEESSLFGELPELLSESPNDFLNVLAVVMETIYKRQNPDNDSPMRIVVRVSNTQDFIIPRLEDIKSSLIGKLAVVAGSVVRVSTINLLVLSMEFLCLDCRSSARVRFSNGKYEPLTRCLSPDCRSKKVVPDRTTSQSVFFQRIRLQEIDADLDAVSAGKMPKTIECELQDDLVDSCVSGDVVEVSGVLYPELTADSKKAKGIFSSYIEVNSVVHRNCAYSAESEAEETVDTRSAESLKEIAGRPDVVALLVKSLCPQIYGQELVKFGLLLSLFGGTSLSSTIESKTRSDIHVLIVGDPGMGKSQLLQYLTKVSPRGFYVCGKSTTTAGLTVGVCRDPVSNEQTLEAGALVLSDRGLCCIDEFDKMSSDHTALLEAMEQQTVSVAKGGVLCSLAARCSVVASANPAHGRYNERNSVVANVRMSAAVLSRFDLVFALLDKPDEANDKKLTEHVLAFYNNKRKRGHNEEVDSNPFMAYKSKRVQTEERKLNTMILMPDAKNTKLSDKLSRSAERIKAPLAMEDMRKYVAFGRLKVFPRLGSEACRAIQKFYVRVREAEGERTLCSAAFPVTTRLLESLIRLSQARAKLELRDAVTKSDALEVIELVIECMANCSPSQEFCRGGNLKRGRQINLTDIGGLSKKKQTEHFIERLRLEATLKDDDTFDYRELLRVSMEVRMNVGDFSDYVAELNNAGVLLLKGAQKYKLLAK